MKKLLLIALCVAGLQSLQAQKVYAWWDAGVKASYGLTGFLNSKLINDKNYSYHLNSGGAVGAKFGMYFGLNNGITFDFMYSGYKQGFDYDLANATIDHNVIWKNYDLALLYRHQSNGSYIELGPQMSLVRSVKNEYSNNVDNGDVTGSYNKKYYSAIFGVGGYIFGYENFTLMMGLRLGYALTDFVNDSGKTLNFPTPNQAAKTAKDASTNPAFVQLVLEANLGLGQYAKTSCSKRAHLFSSF
ncbi:MAG: hypothetical protein U0V49_02515 [Saprospiraceae bacterium]